MTLASTVVPWDGDGLCGTHRFYRRPDLLGTPEEHKKLKLYETDHIVPMNDFIKETLAWLDRYLGPVQ